MKSIIKPIIAITVFFMIIAIVTYIVIGKHFSAEDGMKNVISKSDGKFVYDETTWFRKWKLLDKYYDKVQVTREDGLSSLLDKRTKKLSKENVWYKDFRLFVDNTIIATNTDNLSTLIDGDTLEVIYPNLLFKEIHEFSDKYYLN